MRELFDSKVTVGFKVKITICTPLPLNWKKEHFNLLFVKPSGSPFIIASYCADLKNYHDLLTGHGGTRRIGHGYSVQENAGNISGISSAYLFSWIGSWSVRPFLWKHSDSGQQLVASRRLVLTSLKSMFELRRHETTSFTNNTFVILVLLSQLLLNLYQAITYKPSVFVIHHLKKI